MVSSVGRTEGWETRRAVREEPEVWGERGVEETGGVAGGVAMKRLMNSMIFHDASKRRVYARYHRE